MPDIFYKTVKEVTRPAFLVAVSIVTTKVETVLINPDGTRVPQEPQTKTEITEKWSVKAMVDTEWAGVAEEEFFFPRKPPARSLSPVTNRYSKRPSSQQQIHSVARWRVFCL